MKNNILRSLFLFLILLLHSCVISDLNDPSNISGKVTDPTGKGLSDVTIGIKTSSTETSIITSEDGTYNINLQGGGIAVLTFSKEGFTSQTSSILIKGGEKKIFDIKLNLLSEDAYLIMNIDKKTISNVGETFFITISTNTNYYAEWQAEWISCTKSSTGLSITCSPNDSIVKRKVSIILKTEYDLTDTIKVTQLAGPTLRVTDYLGKNNITFPYNIPFVSFSREISVISCTGSGISNVPFEISNDQKTVYFNNIKLNIFSKYPIQLTVKDADNNQLTFKLELKLYENFQIILPYNGQYMYFTNDNQYVWIYTIDGSSYSLRQFTTSDFTELNQIPEVEFNSLTYNPYNNSLYTINKKLIENRYVSEIKIFDAATGVYKSKFTIDYNGYTVAQMAFSDNGYGIMMVGEKLFYIDSSKNNEWGLLSESSTLYDISYPDQMIPNHIEMCNNNKIFILYGTDTGGKDYTYTYNADTKLLTLINNTFHYGSMVTSNSGTGVALFSRDVNNIMYQDVLTKSYKTLNLPTAGIGNLTILTSEDSYPYIFTSDISVISTGDNTVHSFSNQGECYYIKSSNDGKQILINKSGYVFLFRSEVFTKYYEYIK